MLESKNVLKVFAFSSGNEGGNPAGVVIDANGLTEFEMQTIARTAGYPETAFVSKSNIADYRFDFFTPSKRIADCGHATVAAFSILKTQFPELTNTSKEIINGVRNIQIKNERVYMEQPIPQLNSVNDGDSLMSQLFKKSEGFVSARIARHDVGFLLIELSSEISLRDIVPNFENIKTYSEKNDLVGVYVFVKKQSEDVIATTRMFAPAYGIDEESATGMAAGLLSMHFYNSEKRERFIIEQGRYMLPSSTSLIYCEVEPDKNRILVGGYARL
jgi:PhzF family phenazine biosynthesis protein